MTRVQRILPEHQHHRSDMRAIVRQLTETLREKQHLRRDRYTHAIGKLREWRSNLRGD